MELSHRNRKRSNRLLAALTVPRTFCTRNTIDRNLLAFFQFPDGHIQDM